MEEFTGTKEYKKTGTYKNADKKLRLLYEQYKTENNVSDEHMTELLTLEDLRAVPKEEKAKGNRIPQSLLIISMLFFVIQMNGSERGLMMIVTAVMVIFSTVIYLTGAMNPYSMAVRKAKKKLKKKFPKVPDLHQWISEKTDTNKNEAE